MKHRIVVIAIGVATVAALLALLSIIHASQTIGRDAVVGWNCHQLAAEIDYFRHINHHNPASLQVLFERIDPENALVDTNRILHDKWHDEYEVKYLPNGMLITVVAPDTLFRHWNVIERTYSNGEAWKPME